MPDAAALSGRVQRILRTAPFTMAVALAVW
jgi:hypothetical protein